MATHKLIGRPRVFIASDGVQWTVGEYRNGVDVALADRCLVFACDAAMRRVREYPANWREFDAEALVELSWTR